ncbi:hypothetical protein [uncultured Vibrio sp.]|uniref:hypothetical protein n=1 Tax=uncultured Vibrio sp. TaxID=114054 RepID=UPI0025D5BCA7|nr:hypothetical protein [uncultured Vibrio sp.]
MYKLILCLFALFIPASFVHAASLPVPTGEVMLWVSGKIEHSNTSTGVELDEKMVSQLKASEITTKNHVVQDDALYKGPTLKSVLEYVGASGNEVKVIAWDDYIVTIPLETIEQYGVLLATHENGVRMTLDDKGPFFIVFPFNDYSELRNDFYYNLSVWQVKEIVVE